MCFFQLNVEFQFVLHQVFVLFTMEMRLCNKGCTDFFNHIGVVQQIHPTNIKKNYRLFVFLVIDVLGDIATKY